MAHRYAYNWASSYSIAPPKGIQRNGGEVNHLPPPLLLLRNRAVELQRNAPCLFLPLYFLSQTDFFALTSPVGGRMGDHYNLLHKAKNWGKGEKRRWLFFLAPPSSFWEERKKLPKGGCNALSKFPSYPPSAK